MARAAPRSVKQAGRRGRVHRHRSGRPCLKAKRLWHTLLRYGGNVLWFLLVGLASATEYRVDFSTEAISGDPGTLLEMLARHQGSLNACLQGVESAFAGLGRVPAIDVRVLADGQVGAFGFTASELSLQSACLRDVVEGLALPPANRVFGKG